uniref:Box C/D snoRNA protein 1 n=1 Tax=Helianthus annuus TaxID=4232 RepID=A0A251T8L5_HELAN
MSVHHSIDNTALSASVKRQYCPSTEKSYDFRKSSTPFFHLSTPLTPDTGSFEDRLSSPSSKLCDECKTNEFKYKCPGCSVRSCSLPCVKAHKQRTGCTGKRQQLTEFVPLSKFDDNLLLSGINRKSNRNRRLVLRFQTEP